MSGEGQGEVLGEPSPQLWAMTVAGSGCSLGASRKTLCLGGECGRRGPLQMAQPLAPSRWHNLASLRGLRRRGGDKQIIRCQAPTPPPNRVLLLRPFLPWCPGRAASQAQPGRTRRGTHGEARPLLCVGWHLPGWQQAQAGTEAGQLDSMRESFCAQPLLQVPPSLRTLGGPGCVGQGQAPLPSDPQLS